MKLNYYGYSIRRLSDNSHYRMDCRQFIKAFVDYDNSQFKSKFTYSGEHIYLIPATLNLYLLIITRSDEIIKRVKADNTEITVNELYNLLQRNETIGFASYVYVEKYYFAFASKVLSPKTTAFGSLINGIFDSLNIMNYRFEVTPFLQHATRAEVMSMPFKGRTTMQFNSQSGFFSGLSNFFGGNATDYEDVESIEVIIRPKDRKNIDLAISKAMSNVPDAGLNKMIVKAKEDIHDKLMDLYIISEGSISDIIETNDERQIFNEISTKTRANITLQEKVNEYEHNTAFTNAQIESISHFDSINNWSGII